MTHYDDHKLQLLKTGAFRNHLVSIARLPLQTHRETLFLSFDWLRVGDRTLQELLSEGARAED
jgi:hypothetical protein